MQKVDFIPKLQRKLVIQKEEFRVKKEIVTRENARLERRGLGELVRFFLDSSTMNRINF
jgi:hypothetical protein